MCDQHMLRSARAYAQSDQCILYSLELSMTVKQLTEHHLEFLSSKGSCTCFWVYTCQTYTLLEATCHSSYRFRPKFRHLALVGMTAWAFVRDTSHVYYYLTFAFCKGGASWMRNEDWSTLGIGKSWKGGVVLFKSNCIILSHNLSHYLVLKRPAK